VHHDDVIAVKRPEKKLQCTLKNGSSVLKCTNESGITESYRISGGFLSRRSKEVKKKKIDNLVSMMRQCQGQGKCVDDISLTVFKLDSCPSCKDHEKVIKIIKKQMKLDVEFKNVKDTKVKEECKILGCNAVPCVSMKIGKKSPVKLYEGNEQEISVMSRILGVPNPLLFDWDNDTVPERLLKEKLT
jgi:hypothetical protein